MKSSIYLLRIKNRLCTIRKDILSIFFITISIILFTELLLYKYPAFNELTYRTGQILLKLSYSYVSAFIFYFLVVHLSKENKKISTFRIISMKLTEITRYITIILHQIELNSGDTLQNIDFDTKTLSLTLAKIKSRSKVSCIWPMNIVFEDWHDFLHYNGEEIKRLTTELFLFNESMDNEILELVGLIDNLVSSKFTKNLGKPGNVDLVFYADSLSKLNALDKSTNEMFQKKYGRYRNEVTHKMEKRGELK